MPNPPKQAAMPIQALEKKVAVRANSSKTKPLVEGTPTAAIREIPIKTTQTGIGAAKPPNSPIRRVRRRSSSIPTRRISAATLSPRLNMPTTPPTRPNSCSLKRPRTIKPACTMAR